MMSRLCAVLPALALAACTTSMAGDTTATTAATSAAATGKSCFWPSQVNGFTRGPASNQIYVSTGASEKYLFETMGPCPDLNFSETLGFDQFGAGQICSGLDVTLIVPTATGPQRCPVRMIQKVASPGPGS